MTPSPLVPASIVSDTTVAMSSTSYATKSTSWVQPAASVRTVRSALIGGEKLADRQFLSPALAMWSPNILFGLIGIAGFFQARRAGG